MTGRDDESTNIPDGGPDHDEDHDEPAQSLGPAWGVLRVALVVDALEYNDKLDGDRSSNRYIFDYNDILNIAGKNIINVIDHDDYLEGYG